MTYTVHDPEPLYAAIATRLASHTTKSVGLGEAPSGAAASVASEPYAVVYPLSERFDGSLADPHSIDIWLFQVTCVGGSTSHAQVMQRLARAALLGWAPTVAGLDTTPIRIASGSGILRDDSVQPSLFYSTDRFEIFTSR